MKLLDFFFFIFYSPLMLSTPKLSHAVFCALIISVDTEFDGKLEL